MVATALGARRAGGRRRTDPSRVSTSSTRPSRSAPAATRSSSSSSPPRCPTSSPRPRPPRPRPPPRPPRPPPPRCRAPRCRRADPALPPGLDIHAATSPPTTQSRVDLGPELIVQVRAHRMAQRRSDIADAFTPDLPPVIDLVEFDLGDVITVDPATGERRIRLTVPISDGGVRQPARPARAGRVPDHRPDPPQRSARRERTSRSSSGCATDGFSLRPVLARRRGRASTRWARSPPTPSSHRAREQLEALVVARRAHERAAHGVDPARAREHAASPTIPSSPARLSAALAGDVLLAAPNLPLEPSAAAAAGLDAGVRPAAPRRRGACSSTRSPAPPTQRSVWFDDGTLTAAGAEMVRDLGVQLLVLPYDEYAQLDGSRPGFTDASLVARDRRCRTTPSLPIAVIDPVMSLLDPRPTRATRRPRTRSGSWPRSARCGRSSNRNRARSSSPRPTSACPTPTCSPTSSGSPIEHPDVEFQPLAALPGLTNPFVIDGEWLTVELPSTPEIDLKPRVDAEAIERLRLFDVASMLPDDDPRPDEWDAAAARVAHHRRHRRRRRRPHRHRARRAARRPQRGRAARGRSRSRSPAARPSSRLKITNDRRHAARHRGPRRVRQAHVPAERHPRRRCCRTRRPTCRVEVVARSNGVFPVAHRAAHARRQPDRRARPSSRRASTTSPASAASPRSASCSCSSPGGSRTSRAGDARARATGVDDATGRHPANGRAGRAAHADAAAHDPDGPRDDPATTRRAGPVASRPVSIRIVTDSSCDLPQAVVDAHGIRVVPLSIRFGDAGVHRPRAAHAPPSSGPSAPPAPPCPRPRRRRPASSSRCTARLAAEGATGIVVVSLSGALSATMQSAELAARSVADVDPGARRRQPQRHARRRHDRDRLRAAAPRPAAALDEVAALATDLAARTRCSVRSTRSRTSRRAAASAAPRRCSRRRSSIKPIIEVVDGAVEEGGKQRTRSQGAQVPRRQGGRVRRSHRDRSPCSTPTAPTSTSSSRCCARTSRARSWSARSVR